MTTSKVAKRYAKAWFELAKEKNMQDVVFQDFETIRKISRESRELLRMFYSPIVKTAKKIAVLKAVFTGQLSDLTLHYVLMLTEKGRESQITHIAEAYRLLYLADKNIIEAHVTTATPLDDALRSQFKAIVGKQTGKEVQLVEKVDAEIIGGYMLRIGDKQEDTSIKSKLNRIARDFHENRVAETV